MPIVRLLGVKGALPGAAATGGADTAVRLTSLDAFRGFVMLLIMAEALQLAEIAKARPGNAFWAFLAWHQTHVEWIGASLHDLIQPAFSFLVGAALPFSLARREALGLGRRRIVLQAFRRAGILVLLGIFLRSVGHPLTYFTFEDTLTQIGLGYGFLVLIALLRRRWQLAALAAILVLTWLAFALTPLPHAGFDRTAVGVAADWPHWLSGFAAHWNKNANFAASFDVWLLNLLPRETPFVFNEGGYQTLNFVPTLATMLLGLHAGLYLRMPRPARETVLRLAGAGLIGIALGGLLGALGLVPVAKRIWTPSWVLFSGGWCFLLLAGFYAVLDGLQWRRWAFPLVVIGMNSIVAYCATELLRDFLRDLVKPHIGLVTLWWPGPDYLPLLSGIVVVGLLYWMLLELYRRRIFVRV